VTEALHFLVTNRAEALSLVLQHLALVAGSTAIAASIGLPLGILAARRRELGRLVLGLANLVQTIPSLALFGFLIPVPFIGGIGARTALVALVLYALLPIVRNTLVGIQGIDPAVREAAIAMGMTDRQRLFQVELPLALPVILAGVRVATVISVGLATIAAAIGAGGLGVYIFRGVSMVDDRLILAGAIPAALLAIAFDRILGAFERRAAPRHRAGAPSKAMTMLVLFGAFLSSACTRDHEAVVVGSKNFSEQVLLGEIVAQAVESFGLAVGRRLNLGGTFVCDHAIRAGEIDVYVEYTGTALTAILKQPPVRDPARVLEKVRQRYAADGLEWSDPFGFDNTFALVVRDAPGRDVRTISDLAAASPEMRIAVGYEFMERMDGYRGLVEIYGLRFREPPRVMDLGLLYRALTGGEADVVVGNSTDGVIEKLGLRVLEDDRGYFPPYEAAAVVRREILERHPKVRTALEMLAGAISTAEMRRLNHEVDALRSPAEEVARKFLVSRSRPGSGAAISPEGARR